MTEEHLESLIIRRWSGELGPKEEQELEAWAKEASANRQLLDLIANEADLEKELALLKQIDPVTGYSQWLNGLRHRRRAQIVRLGAWTAAASLLIAVAIGGIFRYKGIRNRPPANVVTRKQPVMPGRNTATLILSNGKKILLDSAGTGELAVQGNTRLVKADSASLSYLSGGKPEPVTMSYNILTTPPSGQYQLTLPDGSRVWLNNLSSIRYPTSFIGKERTVQLTGEAYFEIANNPAKPFYVKVKDETVEVLGTSFNVMAYADEGGTQTTLLTGVVRVRTDKATVQLKPDDQAQVDVNEKLKVIHDVPSQDIVAWKNGFFYFGRAASFASIMRQLGRWYNVDVVYEGKIPDLEFGGKIDRMLPLDELLKYLDKNQLRFRLEGRKLIVLPN